MTGPVQADSEIQQNAVALQGHHRCSTRTGITVLLGNNVMVPLDQSVLYIRPLYVTSTSNPLPQLRYVIAVFNQDVSSNRRSPKPFQCLRRQLFYGTGRWLDDEDRRLHEGRRPRGLPGERGGGLPSGTERPLQGRPGGYQAEENAAKRQVQLAQTALAKTWYLDDADQVVHFDHDDHDHQEVVKSAVVVPDIGGTDSPTVRPK